jgi:hypothetical protein
MPSFITRVELHGRPGSEDYDKLHNAMGSCGFSRTIALDEPATYQLPTAEYYRSAESLTSFQVLNEARGAAASVWKDHSVLVAETNPPIRWVNLRRAAYLHS